MTDRDWWKSATIYQIYPRSYQDTDGDGVGDLAGIESRLDHLADLGVDAIWISPIFPSPMADFGYDVSDYTGIHPMFGTMEEFDRLAAAIKARGMRLLLDFVPGHSSDAHPWFEESRASKDAPKRDWYVWEDAVDGQPPTNWMAHFGGPAWTWDEGTQQYYHHMFLAEQPNLNWRNPEVADAMMDAMRFWYDRGVDGFRVDAFENLGADVAKGDNPPNPMWQEGLGETHRWIHKATQHQPVVFDVARLMRRVAEAYDPPRLLIGEIYAPYETLMRYYGDEKGGMFQLPYNFELIRHAWDAHHLAATITRYEALLPEGAWPNWVLGNHDRSRFPNRFGRENARAALVLLLSLRGTPTLYQGDELAMEDVEIPADRIVDPWGHTEPAHGRDKVRTPMPWGGNRPFTTGDPWLPEGTPPEGTVAEQMADDASPLALTRRLLALRRANGALSVGDIVDVRAEGEVLRYARVEGDDRIEVAINCGGAPVPMPMAGATLVSSFMDDRPATDVLRPHEGRIWRP